MFIINKDKKYYVYEWIRLDTNEPFYIGKGSGNRWCDLTRGHNYHFNNIIKKIPIMVNILQENLVEEEAFQYECWYIYEYKDIIGYNLVNITDGGEGVSGFFCTKETRKKLSAKLSGKDNPAAQSVILLNNNQIFQTIQDAEKLYSLTGISSCCRGVTNSCGKDEDGIPFLWEYYIENKVYDEKHFMGKLKTVQQIKFDNLSKSKKGISPANSRVVVLLNTMEKFKSIAEAKRIYKASSINACCLGRSKYAGKMDNGQPMIWRYDDGTYYDDEYIQLKIDEALNSRKGENSFMYGRHLSDKQKKLIIESRKRNKILLEYKLKNKNNLPQNNIAS